MTASRKSGFRAALILVVVLHWGWGTAAEPESAPVARAAATPALELEAPAGDLSSPAGAEPDPPPLLTREDALELALTHSPALTDSSWQVRSAEARAHQADKIPNPEVDFRYWQLGERDGIQDVERRRIILNQELELGGKRRRRVDLAQLEQRLAGLDLEVRRVEIAALVAVRFAEVLGAQRSVETLGEYVAYVETLLGATNRMAETGAVRGLEIHRVTRRLGLARIDLQRAEADLAVARFGLAAVWGGSSPEFERALGDLEEVHAIPGIEAVIEMARGNVAAERWETEFVRRRAALSLAKASAVPDLRLGLGVAWEEGNRPPDYLIDLEIDVPIFDAKQGDIREARSELSRAEARRDAAEAEGARRIAEVYYALTEAAARSETLAEEVIPAARASFEATRLGFEGQEEDLDNLLDSRRDLANAEVEQTEALVDYHQALALLERLAGVELR